MNLPFSPALPNDAIERVKHYLLNLQANICHTLETVDGQGSFIHDPWQRPQGGGGLSRAMSNGAIFAKAGVNFSQVSGEQLPSAASAQRPDLAHCTYDALGVSLVIHPNNPYVPTSHANVRFFVARPTDAAPIWWFGGGFDLTPYYGFHEDCRHWHQTAKNACDPFGKDIYPHFKAWCDQYFYLPHRQEARGIGGLFFDDYHAHSFEHSFGLMQSIGNHYLEAYVPIVQRRFNHPFSEREVRFQHHRRGRYVEFNLVYDRGTLFGLQSKGRTESILMSLPPEVCWTYQWAPEAGSKEELLYTDYLPARDWLITD